MATAPARLRSTPASTPGTPLPHRTVRSGLPTLARATSLVMALACNSAAQSAHLGQIGPTYPIAEQSLLEHIMARLLEQQRSGALAKFEQQAKVRATESVRSPKPVPGLQRTATARTYHIDPSITLDRNIVDATGALLYPAGTTVNPLDVVSLSRRLLFFDGRDSRQVVQARRLIEFHRGRVKPILVGGSYLDLMQAWRAPVYYDQEGVLVRRLGITQVPAIVSQDGSRLRIDELVVP